MPQYNMRVPFLYVLLIVFAVLVGYGSGRGNGLEIGREEGYYLGVYQHCMDTEPQRYSIQVLNEYAPYIADFSRVCLEIGREYMQRDDYHLEHRGWQWPAGDE